MKAPNPSTHRRPDTGGAHPPGYPHPRPPYRTRDFLDDERQLISRARPDRSPPEATVPDRDGGRMFLIPLQELNDAVQAEQPAIEVLFSKYGQDVGTHRLAQLRLLLGFLNDSRAEVTRAGLARNREPMPVREEFVRYLLDRSSDPEQDAIPKNALIRFLDDWGHRWM